VTWEGCHHKEKWWVAGGGRSHCQETAYRGQGTVLEGHQEQKEEPREETY